MEVKASNVRFNDYSHTLILHHQYVDYKEIVSVEYYEDSKTVSSGGFGVGRAIVGGIMFGAVGAAVGGLSKGTTTETYVDKVFLVLTLEKHDPVIIIFDKGEREKAFKMRSDLEKAKQKSNEISECERFRSLPKERQNQIIEQRRERSKEETRKLLKEFGKNILYTILLVVIWLCVVPVIGQILKNIFL